MADRAERRKEQAKHVNLRRKHVKKELGIEYGGSSHDIEKWVQSTARRLLSHCDADDRAALQQST
eukprot:3728208-Karenia_brevis.AAC.1